MACPQVENGHVDLANELVDVLAKTELNGGEFRFLMALWRKTYGWHKKDDWISLSQMQELTGFSRWYVSKIKKLLVSKRILLIDGQKMAFNKDYSQWVSNSLLVSNSCATSKQQNNLASKQGVGTQKKLLQKKLTKENMLFKKIPKVKKTMQDLIDSGDIELGSASRTGTKSPLDVKIEKKHRGNEFGRLCISLGYEFDKRYFDRFGEHYKNCSFSVSAIAKNVSKYKEYSKTEWIEIIDFYFDSKKSKELVVTLEACLSENTIMQFKQTNKKSNGIVYFKKAPELE